MAAGVPEIAQLMTTLDYIDAMVMSFVTCSCSRSGSGNGSTAPSCYTVCRSHLRHPALHGQGIGTTGSLAQPALYVVAHGLKIVGGVAGGLIAERRHRRALVA
jgi:hypothetical protein